MQRRSPLSIWWFALGYFAAYVPYAALTKALGQGRWPSGAPHVAALEVLPVSTVASLVAMLTFLGATGWWRVAGRVRVGAWSWPAPSRWTFVSGLATSLVIATTTLAYALEGPSLLMMMLLMRGGVLVLAPLVDLSNRHRVRWFSWAALVLSVGSLWVATHGEARFPGWLAAADVALYLLAYFVRLTLMSRLAKTQASLDRRRFFVEEQLVATPAVVTLLALLAAVPSPVASDLRTGFAHLTRFDSTLGTLLVIGVCSQATGVFGALILLDGREHSFCVPVNRASSVLAGVAASAALAVGAGAAWPATGEWWGAVLMVAALAVLSLGPRLGHATLAPKPPERANGAPG